MLILLKALLGESSYFLYVSLTETLEDFLLFIFG